MDTRIVITDVVLATCREYLLLLLNCTMTFPGLWETPSKALTSLTLSYVTLINNYRDHRWTATDHLVVMVPRSCRSVRRRHRAAHDTRCHQEAVTFRSDDTRTWVSTDSSDPRFGFELFIAHGFRAIVSCKFKVWLLSVVKVLTSDWRKSAYKIVRTP